MLKTIKGKFKFIYYLLIVIIIVIGSISSYNLYKLSGLIDGLMTNNLKSIGAANNMVNIVEQQNADILEYIHLNNQSSLNAFYKSNASFYKWYAIELGHITEKGEQKVVDDLRNSYTKYINLFSDIQNSRNLKGTAPSIILYTNSVKPVFYNIKHDLSEITLINENSINDHKDYVKTIALNSTYTIILISLLAAVFGLIFSKISIDKLLKPIYLLTENMKSIKEGNYNSETPVLSTDELGMLTVEFNKMNKRLEAVEKSTKGKLISEKNRSMAIIKSIYDPLIMIDTNCKVLLINNAFEKYFNVKENDILNLHFLDVVKNNEIYEYIKTLMLKDKITYSPKIISIFNNNKEYYFDVVVTQVRDKDNLIKGIVIVFQNVTQLKRLEKAKDDFISTISHEFKTPLTSLTFGTSLFYDENVGLLNDKQKEILNTMVEDTEKLSSLVNNLLKLLKMESEKSFLTVKQCSINDILEQSIRNFVEQAKQKNVKLSFIVDKDLPKVNVDFEKIEWVLNNLISNALKFTSSEDEIIIKSFSKDNFVYVSVKDTGIGIPPEYTKKVFNKFVQVQGYGMENKGVGLGLAISNEIIKTHGGEIWCESELNHGSNFIFKIPVPVKIN